MDVSRRRLMLALMPAVLVVAVLSVGIGSAPITPDRVLAALMGGGDAVDRAIVLDLRLPRAILGLAVGATLGLAGGALQGYLRNPLAEPSVLGASSGAALGAVLALYFGIFAAHAAALPALAILGALVSLGALLGLTRRAESPLTLILAGIAISTLAGAGISLALNLSANPFAGMEITIWLLGSLEDRSFQHVLLALPGMAAGALLLLGDGRSLDALTLGEDGAAALGIDLPRVRLRLLLGVALGVGSAVAVSGAIGFVGLIVPHLVRPLTDRRPSSVLLPGALAGAVLLSLADILVRIIPTAIELRLGVVTAFLGVPVFLHHLMRERRLW